MKSVVDASAVVTALELERPECSLAMADLQRASAMLAPALLASEVGQVLHAKRPTDFGRDAAERNLLLEAALSPFRLAAPSPERRRLAGELAQRHGLSFYDAEYLAAAIADDADLLVTEDRDLLRAARKELGAHRAVDWQHLRRKPVSAA